VRNVTWVFPVAREIELGDDLFERLERHTEEDETVPELIGELVAMYETEGAFLREGYSE
jgi:hypothetical protein